MKQITVICPKCMTHIHFEDWFIWILKTPFHWFGKRKVKCPVCGAYAYMSRVKE